MPQDQTTQATSPTKGDDLLDIEFRQSYFKQLVGQFNTLGNEVKNDEARKQGQTIAAMDPGIVQWDDIYQLERAVIQLESETPLRRRAWALRSEYDNVAPKEYQKYLKSNPPDPETAGANLLRADLVQIQEELNWYYTVLWVQESFRSLLIKRVTKRTLQYFAGYLCIGLFLMAFGFFGGLVNLFERPGAHDHEDRKVATVATNAVPGRATMTNMAAGIPLREGQANAAGLAGTNGVVSVVNNVDSALQRATSTIKDALPVFATYWLVVFAGTLGALVSILRRIQNMALDGNSDMNLVELERNSSSISFSPLLGAVFALLLLFLFMSGLLSGSAFPKASEVPTNLFLGCVPSDCTELAKLFVWCFIAGFAEKFVPDALDKLQSRSTSDQKPAKAE